MQTVNKPDNTWQMPAAAALKILESWAVSAVDEISSSCTKHMAEVEEAVKVLENLITVSGKKE